MAISPEDWKYMRTVADYYQGTISDTQPEGSIRETAHKFAITRTKTRKILVTCGVYNTPLARRIAALRKQGMSIEEIAAEVSMSPSTVSTYLPYENKIDGSLAPSTHAARVRQYRSYEKQQKQRFRNLKESSKQEGEDNPFQFEWASEAKMSSQVTFHRPYRETWEDAEEIRKRMEAQYTSEERGLIHEFISDLEENRKQAAEEIASLDTLPADGQDVEALRKKHGLYPGALSSRNKDELEKLHGGRLPFEPMSVLRLHLELCLPSGPYSVLPPTEAMTDVLCKYGNVEHGQSVSREIVIPSDLPLYALHYVLQKAFGWKNENRHHFFLPLERARLLCHDNASMWSCMVGLLFRSPMMAAENEFWLDDYNGGSFKNWLRKKYTGPYLSQNHSEALIPCQEQMMQLDMNEEFYVCYDKAPDGIEQPAVIYYKEEDESLFPAKPNGKPYDHVKTSKLEVLSPVELTRFFKADPLTLIERLPLDSVIAAGNDHLSDSLTPEEMERVGMCVTGEEMYAAVGRYIHNVIGAGEDTPERQVCPIAFTDVLFYSYGNWRVKITASENCPDLMDRLTQSELDRANLKCRDTYRPVLIARDGLPVLDQVDSLDGYCEFLKAIHPNLETMQPAEQKKAKQLQREKLAWAKSQGWQRDDSTDINFL